MKLLKSGLIFAVCMGGLTLLHSECIDETTTTTYGEEMGYTVCDTYHDGNCIDFHCVLNDYSDDSVICHRSADIKECKNWDVDTTNSDPRPTEEVCCKFDITDASCEDTCTTRTVGYKKVHRECTSLVYN